MNVLDLSPMMATPSVDTVSFYQQILVNIKDLLRERQEVERDLLNYRFIQVRELRASMLDTCHARWDLSPSSAYSAHLKPMAKIVHSYDKRMEYCEQLWQENTPAALKELRKQLRFVEDMMARAAADCLLGWEQATRETKEKAA